MNVARLHAAGVIKLQEEPDPEPAADESLVRVMAVGLCGSDLHWFGQGQIGDSELTEPLVLGHEMSGLVLTGQLAGERVAIDPAVPCWTGTRAARSGWTEPACRPCRDGNPNLCVNVRFAGHGDTDGGLRELIAWPTRRLHLLPDHLGYAEGALLEPMGVAIHALDLAHIRVHSTVAVIGCGPIGLLALQLARRAGADLVLGIDPLEHRRDAAQKLGADVVATPTDAAAAAEVLTDGEGVDIALEIAGNDAALSLAMTLVRPGGRVVLAGIPDDDRTTFSASTARRKGLTLSMVRRMKEVHPRAIAKSSTIELSSLVTDRFELADTAAAFTTAASRVGLKVLIEP